MLGVRLPPDAERKLEQHARAVGRGKSVLAREWILDRLERESIDEQVRRAAEHLSRMEFLGESERRSSADVAEWLRALDEEDGGYEWGDEGPPL